MKTCSKCGEVLPLDRFYRQAGCKNGYRPDCKSCICEARKRERVEHADRVKARDAKTSRVHAEKRSAKARAWYAANPERAKASRRAYYAANPAVFEKSRAKRNALKRGVEHSPYTRTEIFDRDGGRCKGCGLVLANKPRSFHIDHIVPLTLGGPDIPSNLQVMCPPCNRSKWANLEGQIYLPV